MNSGFDSNSSIADARHWWANSRVRSGAWAQKSSSSARCTSEPFVAGIEGGSGTRSIAENRKANAQSLKVETFDGDNELGSWRLMG